MHNMDQVLLALDQVRSHADELRDLDAVLGDGDLGITVSSGASAVQAAFRDGAADRSLSELLIAAGRAFGTANPSTFASLVQGGLLSAAKATRESTLPISADCLRTILSSCAESIKKRGGCAPGDKTVLDPLLRSIDALDLHEAITRDALDDMVAAATEITAELAGQPSAKGRAAWVGDRSVGHRDPGSVAYVRFLEALRDNTAVALNR